MINVEIFAQKSQICCWNLNLDISLPGVRKCGGILYIGNAHTLLQHSRLDALDTIIILLHRMGCAYTVTLSICVTGMQIHVVTRARPICSRLIRRLRP